MKKILILCLAGSIMLSGGIGCAMADKSQSSVSSASNQYTDPALPITVSPGKKIVIVMASNPTTGFGWRIAKTFDEKILKLIGSDYLPSKSNLDGAGGKEVWTFSALSSGQTTIYFEYVRSWEKGKAPSRESAFKVIVR